VKSLKRQRITITLAAAEADLLEQLAANDGYPRTRANAAAHMVRTQLGVAGFCQKGAALACSGGMLCIGARVPYATAAAFRKAALAGGTNVEGLLLRVIAETVERVPISPAEVKAFTAGA